MTLSRRILVFLSWLATICALLALGVWVFGRIVTDRWVFSQWIFWTPTPAVLLGVLGLLMTSHLGSFAASRTSAKHNQKDKQSKRVFKRVRTVAWFCLLLAVFWLIFLDWHSHRRLLPSPKAHDETKMLSIAYWNMATNRDDIPVDFLLTLDEDIVIVANGHSRVNWNAIANNTKQNWTLTRMWPFTIFSRVPLNEWALTQLHLRGKLPNVPHEIIGPRANQTTYDVGLAAFFEFDLPGARDDTFTVWILDLPSDVSLSKRQIAQQTREEIDTFAGVIRSGTSPRKPIETPGFPEADIILGDFNIPRASGSLSAMIDHKTYVGAYESAGMGPCATFPRVWSKFNLTIPLVHIDQMFVNRAHRVLRYRVEDPGTARHWAQRLVIERAESN